MAPSRFDPRAALENDSREKLRMKIMPAKNTGRHNTRIEARILADNDAKKIALTGTKNPIMRVPNKAA